MFRKLSLAVALLVSAVTCEMVILNPPAGSENAAPIAVIWIHGMQCKPEAYKTIGEEFQAVASASGMQAWVGAPEFVFDIPEPLLIEHYVESTLAELRKNGFTGDNVYLAAHSLGGVMAQDYALKSKIIKGQFLMGSVLLRNKRTITDSGETHFTNPVPTMTILGELDGLLRITRGAEAFWHQAENIESAQKNQYPVVALAGVSHSSFMDSTMLPSAVVKSDLKPEVDEQTAHNLVAKSMVSFIGSIQGAQSSLLEVQSLVGATADLLKPLVDGMKLEGSYNMKEPCYAGDLINPTSPKCLAGSPWSVKAQAWMAGDLKGATIDTSDNFHRVQSVTPVHLPRIDNECAGSGCVLKSITVTENYYNRLSDFDTGSSEIGAVEMKIKLKSRQAFQKAAGTHNDDFHVDDEVGNRCAEIN